MISRQHMRRCHQSRRRGKLPTSKDHILITYFVVILALVPTVTPFAPLLSDHRSSLFSTVLKGAHRCSGAVASSRKAKSKKQKFPPQSAPPTNKPPSVGQAVQRSRTAGDLLDAASMLWLPSDHDLPPHYAQEIHHEKRQRWAGQLLGKLGLLITPRGGDDIWNDERFGRAVNAAAMPFSGRERDRPGVEGRSVHESLIGLASVVGLMSPSKMALGDDIVDGVSTLIARAEAMAYEYSLRDAVETRWAARALVARLPGLADVEALAEGLPNLDSRVSNLPFDIIPLGVDWSSIVNEDSHREKSMDQAELVSTLRQAIPFHFDTITTRSGSAVVERRGTAWVADNGIGALAYSGKLMPPHPLPEVVRSAMKETESIVLDDDFSGPFFDCALCNHYPDAQAACKFHTDPEHGTLWDRLTCVVSAGDDRRFAFRPISDVSQWRDWDSANGEAANGATNEAAVYHMFPGDIVKMEGRCNDDFYHAVYAGDDSAAHVGRGQGRVSLVFKRALDRGGRRGHGLAGKGRRSKRRIGGVIGGDNKGHERQPNVKADGKSRRRRRSRFALQLY